MQNASLKSSLLTPLLRVTYNLNPAVWRRTFDATIPQQAIVGSSLGCATDCNTKDLLYPSNTLLAISTLVHRGFLQWYDTIYSFWSILNGHSLDHNLEAVNHSP